MRSFVKLEWFATRGNSRIWNQDPYFLRGSINNITLELTMREWSFARELREKKVKYEHPKILQEKRQETSHHFPLPSHLSPLIPPFLPPSLPSSLPRSAPSLPRSLPPSLPPSVPPSFPPSLPTHPVYLPDPLHRTMPGIWLWYHWFRSNTPTV